MGDPAPRRRQRIALDPTASRQHLNVPPVGDPLGSTVLPEPHAETLDRRLSDVASGGVSHNFATVQIAPKLPRKAGHNSGSRVSVQRDAADSASSSNLTLTTPSLLGPPRPRFGLQNDADSHLHLDPEIEAAILTIQRSLAAENMRTALANLQLPPDSVVQAPASGTLPPAPAPGPTAKPLVPAGAGPKEPRPASSNDLLKAALALPVVDSAITTLRDQALGQVRGDWRKMQTGEKAVTVSTLAVISLATLAGAASNVESRRFLLDQINGKVLQVPGADWLHVEVGTNPDNLMLGLHLDVGRLLPGSLGFGPSTPQGIGGPPRSVQREAATDLSTADAADPITAGSHNYGAIAISAPGQGAGSRTGIGQSIVQAGSRQRGIVAPDDVARRINAAAGSGQPLGPVVQQRLELGIGADLSNVRVHADAEADGLTRSLQANAFTSGSDVFFRSGHFAADSTTGIRLLAHEAAHTVQQAAGGVHGVKLADSLEVSHPADPEEQAARRIAEKITIQPGDDASTERLPASMIDRPELRPKRRHDPN